MSSPNLEITRKRLKWRATHRGIKEMDILVGGFAEMHLKHMTESQLTEFAALLELPDQDLLSWATGQAPIPTALNTEMFKSILAHRPEGFK